jgi:hypothetical protein
VVASIVIGLLLSACAATPSGHSPAAAKPPFSVNERTVCASTPASPATARPHAWFEQARAEWKLGERSDSASEGLCWAKAADDLESITTVATTGTSGFLTAANQLLRLASMPDTMDTPAQGTEIQNLIASLDRFFGTHGAYED